MTAERWSDTERYRWCVYCRADCLVDDPKHDDTCPQVTGVYPVRSRDTIVCVHCDKPALGNPHCIDCHAELAEGDHYMLREVQAADPILPGAAGASVSELICIGCGLRDAIATDKIGHGAPSTSAAAPRAGHAPVGPGVRRRRVFRILERANGLTFLLMAKLAARDGDMHELRHIEAAMDAGESVDCSCAKGHGRR